MATKPIDKKWIVAGVVVIIVLILISMVWGAYNNFVRLDQGANEAFANLQAQYQRRFDLIPNLVDVTSKYAVYERTTLTEITQLRSQWQTNTPAQLADSDNQFQAALSRLLLISENYPTLRADTQFTALQDGLTETENMVSVARTRYNNAIRDYNTAVQVFPGNVFAGWFGFSQKDYFEATNGADQAPKVNLTV
jgi:LemA protein